MEYVEIVEHYPSRSVVYEVFPIGDVHYGLVITDEERLDKAINYIKRHKYARWIGMGELIDLIVPGDRRFDEQMLAPWVDTMDVAESQIQYVLNKLMPIKDKCWGLLNDNHTEAMRLKINRDAYSELVRKLETNRLGFSCFMNVIFPRANSDVNSRCRSTRIHLWLHHGWFGGRLMGETALNLERLTKSWDADLYLVAHGHKGMIIPLNYITARYADDRGNRPIVMNRWAMMTQHWMNAYKIGTKTPPWAERRGFWPHPVGAPIIRIKPATRYIEVVSGGELIAIPENRNNNMQD